MKKTSIITLLIGTLFFLKITGFCFSRLRYATDQELITSAVRDALRGRAARDFGYQDIGDFFEKNPNCCSVLRNTSPFNKYDEFFTFLTIGILNEIELKYIVVEEGKLRCIHKTTYVNACASAKESFADPRNVETCL